MVRFPPRRHLRLGDWQIAQDVWPDGPKSLKALADYVHAKGMEFGLWFEPEMVNPDSDVARNHPDWILSPTAGRLPLQGRTQQVLDLTNPDAFDYIYGCMDQLVGELGIDYIKWDHNKLVTEPGSRRSGRRPCTRRPLPSTTSSRASRPHIRALRSKAAPLVAAAWILASWSTPIVSGSPTAWTRSSARTSSATPRCWCRRR